VSHLKIKIPSKNISANNVTRRDLIPALRGEYIDGSKCEEGQ
jgi:hypothetical protein